MPSGWKWKPAARKRHAKKMRAIAKKRRIAAANGGVGKTSSPIIKMTYAKPKVKVANSVSHPQHYTRHPSGVECITITEHMNFNIGNAVKYLWRADLKGEVLEDLQKARWYLNREISKRMAAR